MPTSADLATFVPQHHDSLGDVRIVMRDREPWFVAADLARILEINTLTRSVARLDPDERDKVDVPTATGAKTMVIVSEPGMYRLVLTSRADAAEGLRRWLTHDVLPRIRKHGAYLTDKLADEIAAVLLTQDRCTDQALVSLDQGRPAEAALRLRQGREAQDKLNELIDREPLPITRGVPDIIRKPEIRQALGLGKHDPAAIAAEYADDVMHLPPREYRYPAQYAR